ncbi:hypothetical protein BHM03_00057215 [Ensete ventricosum]|nr:hypothetical protein BHM03_00057215 [Ensete ventricosum]
MKRRHWVRLEGKAAATMTTTVWATIVATGEVAMLGQRWLPEITVVEASSIMQAVMLAMAKVKKGDV